MSQGGFPLGEIWSAVKRRLWLLIVCVAIITPAGLIVAIKLPSVYSSTAKILVESQQIPDSLVQSTVQVDAAERMALIQQRLLTRQNLLDMADRLDLFAGEPDLSPSVIQQRLLAAIRIEDIQLRDRAMRSRGPVQASAFTITFSSPSPIEAARVANELVSMALEQNVETRSQRATETRRFLEKKAADLSEELSALEREIAAFKIENGDALPESLRSRRDERAELRARSYDIESQLIPLEERKSALEESLRLGRNVSGTPTAGSGLTPEEVDLRDLERQLTQARGIFADTHPNIRALVSRIEALSAEIERQRAEAAEAGGTEQPAATREDPAAAAARSAMRREIGAIDRRLEAMRKESAAIALRQEELAASIARTPEVEIALLALERRHEDLTAQYQDAVRKEAAATAGEELEISRQAERYRVLEQAQTPEKPDWPPRKLIALGGAGGSVFLGLLLMVGAELRNQSVRTAAQVERRVNIRPLGTIPRVRSRRDRRVFFWRTLLICLVLSGALAGALLAAHQYFMPLDLLAEQVINGTGLRDLLFSGGDDG